MSQRTEITRFQFYICMGYKYNLFLKPNSWTFSFSQCCYFTLPAVSADGMMGGEVLTLVRSWAVKLLRKWQRHFSNVSACPKTSLTSSHRMGD